MIRLTIVDLALHAASTCPQCRQGSRPMDMSDQVHGDFFTHETPGEKSKSVGCSAAQIWVLIRRLEEMSKERP